MRDNTVERLNVQLDLPIGSATVGRAILSGQKQTKWMNKDSSEAYSLAIERQGSLVRQHLADEGTRRAVIHGPQDACWVATQLIKDKEQDGYHLTAFYRSLDTDHADADADIQAAIGHAFVDRLLSCTFFVTCLHTYLEI